MLIENSEQLAIVAYHGFLDLVLGNGKTRIHLIALASF